MDFGFSEEQRDVQNLARQILSEQVTPEKLAQFDEYQETAFDRDLWAKLAEAGMNEEANDKTSKGYEEYRQIIDFAIMRKITYP